MLRILTSLVVLTATPALACKCELTYLVCREVAASNPVFIATVTSVGPAFIDPWHRRDPGATVPAAEIESLRRDGSPKAIARLKSIYLGLLSGLPDQDTRPLREANTFGEVESAFELLTDRDRRAHFKVKTVFRQVDDDDKDTKDDKGKKDADDDEKPNGLKEVDLWTPKDDCGIDFQKGETYLVYAGNDEEEGKLSTSVCYRTKRLTDAGPDLAYLNFFRDGGDFSSRMEGFVTTERNQDSGLQLTKVESPLPNAVVGLRSSAGVLYTRSGPDGRFVFDGLSAGDYDLSVFGSGFPLNSRLLTGPQTMKVGTRGCANPMIVVPPRDAGAGK